MHYSTSFHHANAKRSAGRAVSMPSNASSASPLTLFRGVLIGLGCTVGIGLLLLLAATWLLSGSEDPNKWIRPLSLTALYLTAMLSGVVSARLTGLPPVFGGLLSGLLLSIACIPIAISLPAAHTVADFGSELLFRLLTLFFAVLGASLGKKSSFKNKHHKFKS